MMNVCGVWFASSLDRAAADSFNCYVPRVRKGVVDGTMAATMDFFVGFLFFDLFLSSTTFFGGGGKRADVIRNVPDFARFAPVLWSRTLCEEVKVMRNRLLYCTILIQTLYNTIVLLIYNKKRKLQ